MAPRLFSSAEIERILKTLRFRKLKGRGKGSHLWYVREVCCYKGEKHTMSVNLPAGRERLHPDTQKRILDSMGLSETTAESVLTGKLKESEYLDLISLTPKGSLLPVPLRGQPEAVDNDQ